MQSNDLNKTGLEQAVRDFMPFAQVAFLWTHEKPPVDEVNRYREAYHAVLSALTTSPPHVNETPETEQVGDGMEVRAWEHADRDNRASMSGQSMVSEYAISGWTPLVTLSSASVLISQRDARIEKLTQERDEWRNRSHRKHEKFADADERAWEAEAQVSALRAALDEIADFDPDGPIDPNTVRLIRIAGAARREFINPAKGET